MDFEQTSQRAFLGISASLFVASATVTMIWCGSMSAIEMPMQGSWTMSMMWMRMPGQTWPEAAASFLTMWIVMMAAMMLPSHVPMLGRYRRAVRSSGHSHLGTLTLVTGLGYFTVWALLGAIVFPLGAALATLAMAQPELARAVPAMVSTVIISAGLVQFTKWKAHYLALCRAMPMPNYLLAPTASAAWRQGLRLGVHCSLSCANLTVILLVAGAMDLRVMAVVTAAVSAERLAPSGERIAQATGGVVIGAGLILIAQAMNLA